MPFNDGFSTESIPYVSPEISGTVLVADGNEWVAAIVSSGGGGGISAVSSSGNITGSGLSGNEIRLKDNITVTNLTVTGTGSFQLLNVLSQSELQIGDKYITILTGGVDHASLDGSGILWGSGSTSPTVGDRGENAHILYRASNDVLEIFPGLSASVISASVITSSNLYVSNNISASTFTGSFSGSFLGVNEVIAGSNLTSSTAGTLQTLALTSSVIGLNNLQSTNISASYITGSRVRITDDPNIIPLTSSLHEYNLYSISNHRGNAYFYQELTDNIPSSSFGNLNVRTLIAHTGSRTSIWGINNTTIISASVGTANFINAANYALSLITGSAATASVMTLATSYVPGANLNAISQSFGLRLTALSFGAKRYPLIYTNFSADAELSIDNDGNLSVGKRDANAKLDVNGNVIVTGSLTITTGSIVTANPKTLINAGSSSIVDTYSINNRTARFTAMAETTTGTYHVQSIDLLVANNGSSALITPYALVSTNGAYLASFDVAINGSSIELTATNLSGENIAVTLNKNYII